MPLFDLNFFGFVFLTNFVYNMVSEWTKCWVVFSKWCFCLPFYPPEKTQERIPPQPPVGSIGSGADRNSGLVPLTDTAVLPPPNVPHAVLAGLPALSVLRVDEHARGPHLPVTGESKAYTRDRVRLALVVSPPRCCDITSLVTLKTETPHIQRASALDSALFVRVWHLACETYVDRRESFTSNKG